MGENTRDKIEGWKYRWSQNDIGWHQPHVHHFLQKHSSLLFKKEETKKIFVPLCGKTLDMKWLSDKGQHVVGLDGVRKGLEDFCYEQGLEWTEEDAPSKGPGFQVLKVKGRQLNLYRGDIFQFKTAAEEQFDCVWESGGLVSVDRNDVKPYADVLKDLTKPGGKIMVESLEFDITTYADSPDHPPWAMFEDEMKYLFEPDCTLEEVDRGKRMIRGTVVDHVLYLIVKKN